MISADPSRRRVPEHVVLEREPGLLERLAPEDRAAFEPIAVIQTSAAWEKMQRDVMPGLNARDKAFLDRLWKGYAYSDEAPLRRVRFEKPALIITGRQDSSVGYEEALDLLPRFPRATYAVLDRAGHNLQFDQTDVFEALAGEWLDRVERSWGADKRR